MPRPTDKDLEITVASMLRFGITLAALVVLVGGVFSLRHPLSAIPDYSHFRIPDKSLRTLTGVFHGALHLQPRCIIQLGLLLLILTPVARVVFCVVGFARQRDRLYMVVSATVLAVLLYSLTKAVQ